MKNFGFVSAILLLAFTLSTQAQASGEIVKESEISHRLLIRSDAQPFTLGQRIVVVKDGKYIGKLEVSKVSKSGLHAIATLEMGRGTPGDSIMSVSEYKLSKLSPKFKNDDDEYLAQESDPKKLVNRSPASEDDGAEDLGGLNFGLLAGYGTALFPSYITGGFSLGLNADYQFDRKWSSGFTVDRINSKFDGVMTSGNTKTTLKDYFTTTYILFDLKYHLNPSFYVGPTIGWVKFANDDIDDNYFGMGGVFGCDYNIAPHYSIGGRADLTWLRVTDSRYFQNTLLMNLSMIGKYWF